VGALETGGVSCPSASAITTRKYRPTWTLGRNQGGLVPAGGSVGGAKASPETSDYAFTPAMETVAAKHAAKTRGTSSCLDRVLFRGCLPPKGDNVFLQVSDLVRVHIGRTASRASTRYIRSRIRASGRVTMRWVLLISRKVY
jgi:hypothetical protein